MGFYDIGLHYSADRAHGRTMSESDLGQLCTVAGWVHDNAQAVCIIMAESNGKTDALSTNNPAGPDHRNIGLFQIWAGNVAHPDYLKDPVYNANVARRIYRASGNNWSKWATASKCAGKSGNVPHTDEATNPVDDAARAVTDIPGQISGMLNSIPWFRMGKGALGFVLLIGGAYALIFVVANKASKTPAGKVATSVAMPTKAVAGKAGKAASKVKAASS